MIQYDKHWICLNGEISECDYIDKNFASTPSSIYEVVRIIDGIPLFIEAHLQRLMLSCKARGLAFDFNKFNIEDGIFKLIHQYEKKEGNIEIIIQHPNNEYTESFYIAHYIPHKYPSPAEYTHGVEAVYYYSERVRPEIKSKNKSLRDASNVIIKNQNVYEVILVNKQRQITEGSRSNIFFVKNNSLYTAPESMVLNGISRQIIIKLARLNGIPVNEESVLFDNIHKFDSAFLTGTSPKILPIKRLENCTFNVNSDVIQKLIESFDDTICIYIKEKKDFLIIP
ncbi:MAG: aminotransferase class IV [Bacteroidales bacterium]|nr:aminotransferase class IV [Bacteroidales bacterium]